MAYDLRSASMRPHAASTCLRFAPTEGGMAVDESGWKPTMAAALRIVAAPALCIL
jgi:hypothetical protein